MSELEDEADELASEISRRRGRSYPAHEFIARTFPDYMRRSPRR